MEDQSSLQRDESGEPIEPTFYPSKRLGFDAPWRWLRLGWQDLLSAKAGSLGYGIGLVLFGYRSTWLAWDEGHTLALFTLATAFILAGPVRAFGLYSISRQLEQGRSPHLGTCWLESRSHLRNEMLFALVMLVVLLMWARTASMVRVLFPLSGDIGLIDWLLSLAVGSAVGSIFAAIVFSSSVVALPTMLDRDTDAIISALASINAVLRNQGVMLL